MAYFFGFAAVAGTLSIAKLCSTSSIFLGSCGGLIAFGVQHVHASIHDWRILFIIEVNFPLLIPRHVPKFLKGLPAILMGLVVFCFLPNRPESTVFLNERERAIALDRMNRATSGDVGAKVNRGDNPGD